MNYTDSPDAVIHGGTGHPMHDDSGPVDTVWAAKDANMLIWSLMKLLADASVSAASFNPAASNTYDRVSLAVQAMANGTVGTFAPVLSFGGASTGMAYTQQVGRWVRRGRVVTWWIFILLSAKGSATGDAKVTLTGLPAALANYPAQGSVDLMAALTGHISGMQLASTNEVEVRMFNGSSSEAGSATHANFTDTSHLYLRGEYYTES